MFPLPATTQPSSAEDAIEVDVEFNDKEMAWIQMLQGDEYGLLAELLPTFVRQIIHIMGEGRSWSSNML